MNRTVHLNLRYMLTEALYFGTVCTGSFMAAYLLDKGMANTAIGILLGASQGVVVILQPILGARVDRHPKFTNAMMCAILALITIFSALGLFFHTGVDFFMTACTILFISSSSLMQPFTNALAFDYEKLGYKIRFGLGRGIGSASFAAASYALGFLMKSKNPLMLPVFAILFAVLFLAALTWFSSARIHRMHSGEGVPTADPGDSLFAFIKNHKKFIFLQFGGMGLFFGHMLINTYLLQIENSIGGDSGDMGIALFAAAMVEVPVMFLFERLAKKIHVQKLLLFSACIFCIKIFLTAFAASPVMLLLIQLLEAGAFAVYLPASVYYAKHLIHERNQAKGQTFVIWATSAGSIAAALLGGLLLDQAGVRFAMLVGFFVSMAGTVIVAFNREALPPESIS